MPSCEERRLSPGWSLCWTTAEFAVVDHRVDWSWRQRAGRGIFFLPSYLALSSLSCAFALAYYLLCLTTLTASSWSEQANLPSTSLGVIENSRSTDHGAAHYTFFCLLDHSLTHCINCQTTSNETDAIEFKVDHASWLLMMKEDSPLRCSLSFCLWSLQDLVACFTRCLAPIAHLPLDGADRFHRYHISPLVKDTML